LKTIEHTAPFIFKNFKQSLFTLYDRQESERIAEMIFEHEAQLTKVDLMVNPNLLLDEKTRQKIATDLQLLILGKPVQYVIGSVYFYGLTLKVSSDVLIPRQETEELVNWIVKENKLDAPKILDLCTGSGCIALALKSVIERAEILAIDISEKALEIAKQNTIINNFAIEFLQKDILKETLDENLKFEIIVSNPPYVKNSEKELMHQNVLEHEPHLALFVKDEDPLIFYKRIIILADRILKPEGRLYFEINELYGEEISQLLLKHNYKAVEIKKDLNGKLRMIRAIQP
jgi:release factor glutamine methyltransferase